MQMEQGRPGHQITLDLFRRGQARTLEEILDGYAAIRHEDVIRVVETHMGPAWRERAIRYVLGPASATGCSPDPRTPLLSIRWPPPPSRPRHPRPSDAADSPDPRLVGVLRGEVVRYRQA